MMRKSEQNFAGATRRLAQTLRRETSLARAGSLPELAAAGDAKAAAFRLFMAMHATRDGAVPVEAERDAVQDLIIAADENTIVLEAVRATLDDVAEKLKRVVTSAADPGTYGPTGRGPRHTLAARVDATV